MCLKITWTSISVNSLQCWECSSTKDAFCDDPFVAPQPDLSALKECKKPAATSLRLSPVCLTLHLNYSNINRTVTHRTCLWQNLRDACSMNDTLLSDIVEQCKACDDADGCNSASKLKCPLAFALLLILLRNIWIWSCSSNRNKTRNLSTLNLVVWYTNPKECDDKILFLARQSQVEMIQLRREKYFMKL